MPTPGPIFRTVKRGSDEENRRRPTSLSPERLRMTVDRNEKMGDGMKNSRQEFDFEPTDRRSGFSPHLPQRTDPAIFMRWHPTQPYGVHICRARSDMEARWTGGEGTRMMKHEEFDHGVPPSQCHWAEPIPARTASRAQVRGANASEAFQSLVAVVEFEEKKESTNKS